MTFVQVPPILILQMPRFGKAGTGGTDGWGDDGFDVDMLTEFLLNDGTLNSSGVTFDFSWVYCGIRLTKMCRNDSCRSLCLNGCSVVGMQRSCRRPYRLRTAKMAIYQQLGTRRRRTSSSRPSCHLVVFRTLWRDKKQLRLLVRFEPCPLPRPRRAPCRFRR